MANGKYLYRGPAPSKRRRRRNTRVPTALVLVLLILVSSIGGTLAYLATHTAPVENVFTPSKTTGEVEEEFDGTEKTNVNVKNTGNIDAYIRVRLVTYRVNDAGQPIGGEAKLPDFTLGEGWVKSGEYYYYTKPVAPGASPAANLTDLITLVDYQDMDGGRQAIDVMAECIQAKGEAADGTPAVTAAWGVAVDANGNLVL